MVPVSILDSCPIAAAGAAQALRDSIDLAIDAERSGHTRYWLAEHHDLASFACVAPDVMIGQIARATHRIRVGAGGVMLRNHAPLQVAERFAMLEALFPGRIDLGVGRGLGTDPGTAAALQGASSGPGDDFAAAVQALADLAVTGEDGPSNATRLPWRADLPPLWILGSGTESAAIAARTGRNFAFAQHLSERPASEIIPAYRNAFRPSDARRAPYAILALHAICADTEAQAQRLASSARLYYARRRRDDYGPLLAPDEAALHLVGMGFGPAGEDVACPVIAGDCEAIARRIVPQIEAAGADEIMILSLVADSAARRRSHRLIAEALRARVRAGEPVTAPTEMSR
jgi:luciferase family oxidoreductase group 1